MLVVADVAHTFYVRCRCAATYVAGLAGVINVHGNEVADVEGADIRRANNNLGYGRTGEHGNLRPSGAAGCRRASPSCFRQQVHMLRAGRERHLQLAPLEEIELDPCFELGPELCRCRSLGPRIDRLHPRPWYSLEVC